MPQYNFVSPGGMAANAMEQFLLERERQAQLQEESRRRDEMLQMQRQQEQRQAEAQRQQMDALEQERRFRRAGVIAEQALPGDVADESTAALLTEQGFGGAMRRGQPTQGAQLGEDEAGVPQYDVLPGIMEMRGGSRFINAREAEAARAEQAAASTAARVEAARIAAEERAAREAANRDVRAGQAGLQNELTSLRIAGERDKQEAERTKRETAAAAVQKAAGDAQTATALASDLVGRLQTHPGIGAATGALELRGNLDQDAVDFNGIRDQLVAALALPNLGALKGPMSDKDILFVKQLATRLENRRLSEPETRKALAEAQTFLQTKLKQGGTPTPPAGPTPGTRRTINGQLAEWDGRGWMAVSQ